MLSLVFCVIGGCRLKDLSHIRWGRIELTQLDGHPVVLAKLDRSKTDPQGLKENIRIFPKTTNLGNFCPVLLWTRLNRFLPRSDMATGPFINMRTGRDFNTMTVVNGWRQAAIHLKQRSDFSAHSGRRACITNMVGAGISLKVINAIMGYAKNSRMAYHYNANKTMAQSNRSSSDSEDDVVLTTEDKASIVGFWKRSI